MCSPKANRIEMSGVQRVSRSRLWSFCAGGAVAFALTPCISHASGHLTLSFGASSQGSLGERQSHGVRGDAWALGSHEASFGNIDLSLNLSVDGGDGMVSASGSYISTRTGNWVMGLGAVDRHWSFSPHTSLVLSRNAQPLPSIFLRTDQAIAFTHPALAWIGSLGGEFFLAIDGSEAGQDDVRFFGARLTFEPQPGLEFELVRTAQFAGGWQSFGEVLFGGTNEGSSAEANQMAGFGISYNHDSSRLYLQAIGEDEASGLPSCWIYLAGLEHRAALAGFETVLSLEVIDTRIKRTENGFCGPNTAYNNHIHPYTSDGVVMGAPIDSAGRSIHVRAQHDLREHILDWGLGQYTINDASSTRHRLSSARVTGPVAHVGLSNRGPEKRIGGRVTYQGFDLDRKNIVQGVTLSVFAERQF